MRAQPGYGDAWSLLGDLLEKEGRMAEAREVYRRASEAAALSPPERVSFRARAQALAKH